MNRGISWGYIGVIYRDNGKEDGNYYSIIGVHIGVFVPPAQKFRWIPSPHPESFKPPNPEPQAT